MNETTPPMLILIAGPYLSGTGGDAVRIAANLYHLESFALPVYARGHLPLIGEWLANPIIREAGGVIPGDQVFREYQYPVARRLLCRCDAVLRIPGESTGADQDVEIARSLGLRIYFHIDEIPAVVEMNG